MRLHASPRSKAAVVLAAASLLVAACTTDEPPPPEERPLGEANLVEIACGLDRALVDRIWRGYTKQRSEDIVMVPRFPNFSGTFSIPNHSGPWRYLQQVPLIFYGPGIIAPTGQTSTEASVVDVFPTMGRLTGVELPQRAGKVLEEALVEGAPTPKLILVVVWDGVGRNVMDRWPDAWPNLARMEREGTSYLEAVVGSSPSITPAIHSNLGTGAYPRAHGVPGIKYAGQDGTVQVAFNGRRASMLELSTYGDLIDEALGNEPIVGMLGWRSWHMGMLSHGSEYPGGDADVLALFEEGSSIGGNDELYRTPDYLSGYPGLEEAVEELDREDGEVDGEWMGGSIMEMHDNPAWSNWQTEVLLGLIEGEGFGADEVPDLLMVNYKPSDIVGHQHGMDSPQMEATVAAQDEGLGRVLEHLDETVGDYVVLLTADHGHTPSPERTGAWPVSNGQLKADIEAYFETPKGKTLIADTSAVGIFVDDAVAEEMGVTYEDIARFVNGYTLAENWDGEELPEGYEDRGEEKLFAAAFPGADIPEIVSCLAER